MNETFPFSEQLPIKKQVGSVWNNNISTILFLGNMLVGSVWNINNANTFLQFFFLGNLLNLFFLYLIFYTHMIFKKEIKEAVEKVLLKWNYLRNKISSLLSKKSLNQKWRIGYQVAYIFSASITTFSFAYFSSYSLSDTSLLTPCHRPGVNMVICLRHFWSFWFKFAFDYYTLIELI